MGFWLTLMFLLLIYLVIMLILKVMEDKRVQKAREEMPGKVRINFIFARYFFLHPGII